MAVRVVVRCTRVLRVRTGVVQGMRPARWSRRARVRSAQRRPCHRADTSIGDGNSAAGTIRHRRRRRQLATVAQREGRSRGSDTRGSACIMGASAGCMRVTLEHTTVGRYLVQIGQRRLEGRRVGRRVRPLTARVHVAAVGGGRTRGRLATYHEWTRWLRGQRVAETMRLLATVVVVTDRHVQHLVGDAVVGHGSRLGPTGCRAGHFLGTAVTAAHERCVPGSSGGEWLPPVVHLLAACARHSHARITAGVHGERSGNGCEYFVHKIGVGVEKALAAMLARARAER